MHEKQMGEKDDKVSAMSQKKIGMEEMLTSAYKEIIHYTFVHAGMATYHCAVFVRYRCKVYGVSASNILSQ